MRTLTILAAGSDDFRDDLLAAVERICPHADRITVEDGPDTVRASGYSRHYIDRSGREDHESDDGEGNIADAVREAVEDVANEWRDGEGRNRFGED